MIAGPDGVGKSTIAARLVETVVLRGHQVRHFHRLRLLPGGPAASRPTKSPHAHAPYAPWLSAMKLCYLFADQILAWMVRVWMFRRSCGWVVVERGWWDLAVDPLRYRLGINTRTIGWLGRLLPAPDVTIVLDATPSQVMHRKRELGDRELKRQRAHWKMLAVSRRSHVVVDAGPPADEVLESVLRALGLHERVF